MVAEPARLTSYPLNLEHELPLGKPEMTRKLYCTGQLSKISNSTRSTGEDSMTENGKSGSGNVNEVVSVPFTVTR